MLPWQSLPYPSSEITGKIKMEATSSDYVCIDPENPETIVHHPTISDRNVPSISQIDISHRDFDYPEDLHCRLFMYRVIHNSIAPSKELCSKMALGEVGVSLP